MEPLRYTIYGKIYREDTSRCFLGIEKEQKQDNGS